MSNFRNEIDVVVDAIENAVETIKDYNAGTINYAKELSSIINQDAYETDKALDLMWDVVNRLETLDDLLERLSKKLF